MALVAPTKETRNPLPVGRYLVSLEPERVPDFADWMALYVPRGMVKEVSRYDEPAWFGRSTEHVTFEVLQPGVALWWAVLFGPPLNLTDAPRVAVPSVDRTQRALERPVKVVQQAAEAIPALVDSVAPWIVVGVALYLYSQLKGTRHAMF